MVTWQTASLAANTAWTVEMVVQVTMTETGSVVNSDYAVRSDDVATLFGEPVTTEVVDYALTLDKETAVIIATPGDLITYTLAVNNPHATSDLTGLVLTDTIPVSTTLVTATLPYTMNGNVVQWEQASLNAGESWTVSLVVQVDISMTEEFVENNLYGVRSNEVSGISGPPVVTFIKVPMPTTLYLPFITRPNQPPTIPATPSPADGATDQSLTPTLSWTSSDPEGGNLTYDLYLEATNPPTQLIASGLITASHALTTTLAESTTYYWQIVVADEQGAMTTGPIWSFTTILPTFALEVVVLVNEERAMGGCDPVTVNAQLTAAALGHSTDMALNDFTSHTGSDGSTPQQRIADTGYNFSLATENIGWGFPTPQAVVAWWMGDQVHRDAILNCAYTETGVGYYYLANDTGNSNFHHYWTQVFATPATP
jgi:uncharacterized repeat protein (TIGR01451 family)